MPSYTGADMYTHGFDREGRPVCVLRMHTEHGARSFLDAFSYRLRHPDPHSNEQKLRFMIYSMERAIRFVFTLISRLLPLTSYGRLMGPNVEKMVWLVNCTGYNMKHNGEMSFARLLLQTLQDYYPERYSKCFCACNSHSHRLACLVICDAPFVFRALWNMLYPFIDPVTCKKIRFVTGSDEQKRKNLNELFDLNQVRTLFDTECTRTQHTKYTQCTRR